jgi:hypothetical protein
LWFVAGIGTWIVLGLVRPAFRAGDGLVGQYYSNTAWTGSPAHAGADMMPSTAQMNRRWSGAPPAAFSVLWTGYLTIGRAGPYRFATTSDDGSWLWVDEQLVVDNGGVHGPETREGQIQLAPGSHRVRLQFVQFGGGHGLTWSWARDGGGYRQVPSWALSRRRAGYTTVLAARLIDLCIQALAILIVAISGWHVGVPLAVVLARAGQGLEERAAARYRSRQALAFSACAYLAILFLPRADGGLYRAVTTTTRDLNLSAIAMLRRLEGFQSDLNTSRAGEQRAVPERVLAMLALLDRHGLDRYQLSDGISVDGSIFQQMIASAWPRTLERDAPARFVLEGETIPSSCAVKDRQGDVALVYCS